MSSHHNQSYINQSTTLNRSSSGSFHELSQQQYIVGAIPMKPQQHQSHSSHSHQIGVSISSRAASYVPSSQLPQSFTQNQSGLGTSLVQPQQTQYNRSNGPHSPALQPSEDRISFNGLPGLPLNFTPHVHHSANNSNPSTPQFSAKPNSHRGGLNLLPPGTPPLSTINSPSLHQSQSLKHSPSQASVGPQHDQGPQPPLAIVPLQQDIVFEDPLLKSSEAQEAAHRSRALMRSHYKGTGLCILFICVMFIIACPVTYVIARTKWKNELKNFTKEQCTVSSVTPVEYEVTTTCGTATGFRHKIDIHFDGNDYLLCSTAAYHCYSATSKPEELINHQHANSPQINSASQKLLHFETNQLPSGAHLITPDMFSQFDTRGEELSRAQELLALSADSSHYDCTMCLRNTVDQCFSPISDSKDTYKDLTPGTIINNCWEFTTDDDNGHLIHRYFHGEPTELLGYPFIHSWYIFFWIFAAIFGLIAIYYLVKGVGICDCIDPEFWKRRKAAKMNAMADATGNATSVNSPTTKHKKQPEGSNLDDLTMDTIYVSPHDNSQYQQLQ